MRGKGRVWDRLGVSVTCWSLEAILASFLRFMLGARPDLRFCKCKYGQVSHSGRVWLSSNIEGAIRGVYSYKDKDMDAIANAKEYEAAAKLYQTCIKVPGWVKR